ncbi:ComEC/Rec2 family competence protein [Rubripirellula reticaptiva]|uniref:ComEC family competence protein n=1 Tax=Rubripirellula reticaptiva TaxID=2528013 RepID=A0A5C6FBE9_9BACT|nr:ComEC/Rec2 family competence protein [Rubripirellula reticaptiva]TWU57877.1 ComEC family competence protein [Rubripirellula reticaptiva]
MLFLASASIVGILADAVLRELTPSKSSSLSIWIGWITICTFWIVFFGDRSKNVSGIATVLVMLGIGGLDHAIQSRWYERATVVSLIDDDPVPAIVEGVIDRSPVLRPHPMISRRRRENQSPWETRLEVSLRQIRDGRDFVPIDGRVLISVDGRCDDWMPGDHVRVFGSLRGVGIATNPGEESMASFYRRQGLHGRMDVDRAEQIEMIGKLEPGYGFSRMMATIAAKSRDGLLEHLGNTTGPLAVAIVIGQRDFVDSATRDQLLVTGTAHLLSVSGMHLAIVVMMTTWIAMLLRLPMTTKVILVLGVCVFYCGITGSRPPVLRAAVLVSTLMFAIWMRRPGQAINTLSLAALILVIWNPENVFSVGVHLSFMAVTTLVLSSGRGRTGSPVVDDAIRREEQLTELAESSQSMPIKRLRMGFGIVRQLLWFSLCVSMISLPLIWHQFNVVSWISIPTNVVLGPFLFASLATGIVTAACVMINSPFTIVPAMACHGFLSAMRWIIELAAVVPTGHAWLPAPPTWWVVAFYVVIVASLGFTNSDRVRRMRYGWVALWIAIAFTLATRTAPIKADAIEATFVDVGHGTSVIARFGSGDVWLYDCGRLGNDMGSSRYIDQAIWSLGITQLDGVFLSHADSDHFNALPGLVNRFRIDQVCTPPGMLAEPESALDPVRDAIAQHKIPIRELSRGNEIRCGRSTITVLHPLARRLEGSDNANSLVLMLDNGGKPLLLPGDLEPPGTGVLVNLPRPDPGGLLMAPHHGSLAMDAAVVLQWFRPAEAIVSGGQRAERPAVAAMLGTYGSRVHVTARDGAVRVRMDSNGETEVRSWLSDPW